MSLKYEPASVPQVTDSSMDEDDEMQDLQQVVHCYLQLTEVPLLL